MFGFRGWTVSAIVAPFVLWVDMPFAQTAPDRQGEWSLGVFAGNMTNNRANQLLMPGEYDFADNYFTGLAIGYDRQIGESRWSWGGEFQTNLHFGDQEYLEFVLPATIRYRPDVPLLPALESFAFGLGFSYTTSVPQVEIDVRGDSARTMVYWMVETAASVGARQNEIFFRVHHRSDAFGLLEPDSGSNALAIGWRRAF